jgi:polyhydroxyalkanoate synthase subunit PhaC
MFEVSKFDKLLDDNTEYRDWLAGVKRYQDSGFVRISPNYKTLWQKNQVSCLRINDLQDFNADSPTLLIIPSLINRYYILDLSAELSLVRYLAKHNINVLLLDWGEAQPQDAALDSSSYILQYIQPMLEMLRLQFNNLHIMGYCIGGLLSLASAICNTNSYKSLILLATPWDFHSDDYNKILWNNLHLRLTKDWCDKSPLVSGAYLAWLFYLADPVNFAEKYKKFNTLKAGSDAYNRFLAVEHWVNDTVPLTSSFARECLIDWAGNNLTMQNAWLVGEQVIAPEFLSIPALIFAPEYDKIVPMQNALAIAKNMKMASVITPKTGHIGAIVGKDRMINLWNPLLEWLKNI